MVRRQTQAVATRLEGELGHEQFSFIDTFQRDREELPRPDLPLTVGLDGGYVHSSEQRSRRDGWFEVIAGKAIPAEGKPSCFGYVQTYDTKPKRRLFEVLKAHGMQANQQVTFLTDGGEDIRDLPLYLNAQAEHLLDWFHLTMRITIMGRPWRNPCDHRHRTPSSRTRPRRPGQRSRRAVAASEVVLLARQRLPRPTDPRRPAVRPRRRNPPVEQAKLLKAVHEFDSYPRANAGRIPNYGERRRAGEAISTAFTESTVNQVISSAWSRSSRCAGHPRGPPATADPHPRAQRPARRRLPPLVPQLQPSTRPRGARGVASPSLSRSRNRPPACRTRPRTEPARTHRRR